MINELIERANKCGISPETTQAALLELDNSAIIKLFSSLGVSGDPYEYDDFADFLSEQVRATENNLAIDAALAAINTIPINEEARLTVIYALKHLDSELALPFFIEYLNSDLRTWQEQAASSIIDIQYKKNATEALNDEHTVVHYIAARRLEHEQNNPALIATLSHPTIEARRIAAWYMGRKKIFEAQSALERQLVLETDAETKRAIEWSLAILKKYAEN